jgi:hypothetical protein
MKIRAEIHSREGIHIQKKTVHRTAVRCVILHDRWVLLEAPGV